MFYRLLGSEVGDIILVSRSDIVAHEFGDLQTVLWIVRELCLEKKKRVCLLTVCRTERLRNVLHTFVMDYFSAYMTGN